MSRLAAALHPTGPNKVFSHYLVVQVQGCRCCHSQTESRQFWLAVLTSAGVGAGGGGAGGGADPMQHLPLAPVTSTSRDPAATGRHRCRRCRHHARLLRLTAHSSQMKHLWEGGRGVWVVWGGMGGVWGGYVRSRVVHQTAQ